MELGLSSQDCFLKKTLFNLKSNASDGLILQIHHSYSDFGGENKSYRFIHASFSSNGSHLAVSDHKGNIFIIHLEMERYWQLPQVGFPTVISFPILRNHELLTGLDNTSILFIHIETGKVTGTLQGHSVPATEVSYSEDGHYYLTSCNAEAIVWDSSTNAQIHRLSLKAEVLLKKAVFMPVSNHILACFQDDTMHIWKFKSFECIKQIVPEMWRTHHLRAIAITKNGRAMVIGGHSPSLVIFCLDTWTVKSIVEFPDSVSGVKQLEFLSQVFDGGANKILVMLTLSQELVFFDMETLIFLKWVHQSNGLTAKFSLSSNGKYLATILTSGKINIFTTEKVLFNKISPRDAEDKCSLNQNLSNRNHSSSSKRTQKSYESLSSVQNEIRAALSVKKLLPILKQFGEYPQSYRTLIWKTLLKLPENKESFVSLSLKKCHPSYTKLEQKYPLANKSLGNALKKVLSNVSHWCPLFGEVDFLPEFVFPFVKLFHSSPLVCFEVVATVIVNWCQNWFEFYPFPPINMLSVLESVLGYHDPSLLQFYLTNNVTSSVTVCPLFHTAFSEVLTKTEWLKLWDHVLSNEPSFLFMAIVAYNVICQSAVRTLKGVEEIEVLRKKFFHTQNSVDLKAVICKAYNYLNKTPEEIHTRQFFSPFRSLGAGGTYISFLAYPRLIVDASAEKLQYIRQEEEKLLNEQLQAFTVRKALEKKLQHDSTFREKEKLYQELEERMRQTVEDEENRLLTERRKLRDLRQELKLKELQVLETTRNKALDEKIRRKELEFERLLKDISKRRLREKAEVDMVEEEIRNYYSDLLLRKCQLELELGLHDVQDAQNIEGDVSRNLEKMHEELESDLTALQYEWDDLQRSKRIDLCNKITTIKGLISNVESELAKEIINKERKNPLKDERASIQELKKKVSLLENDIELLVRENLEKLQNEKKQQKKNLSHLPRRSKSENSSSNHKLKHTGTTKSKKTVKYISKSDRPGSPVRKITTIRTRIPEPKAELPTYELYKGPGNFENYSHPRSKFTWPSDPQQFNRDSFDEELEPSENLRDSEEFTESENFKMKIHQQPRGDCPLEGKLSKVEKNHKNKKKGKVSKFTIKKDSSLSGGEEEICKSALKARNEIVEEAKRRQMSQ